MSPLKSNPATTVTSIFPPGFFLENITAVPGGGLLVTVAMRAELYYISTYPSPNAVTTTGGSSHIPTPPVISPILLQKFPSDQATMGIICAPHNPNIFYLLTSDLFGKGSKKSYLNVLDLSNPATAATATPLMTFPDSAKGLNGLCALSDTVLLAADSFAGCIWRIDLTFPESKSEPQMPSSASASANGPPPSSGTARPWLADHNTMQGELRLPDFQPGTNGLKYSKRTGYVCYTSTQQRLFCRVRVDTKTLDPADEGKGVEIIARGMQGDDLIIDDSFAEGEVEGEGGGEKGVRSVAYVTTHRDNTILRIPIDADQEIQKSELAVMLRGTEEDDVMTGPTAGVWQPGQEGKVAYFTCDGGLKNPLKDGVVRCAKVVRVKF